VLGPANLVLLNGGILQTGVERIEKTPVKLALDQVAFALGFDPGGKVGVSQIAIDRFFRQIQKLIFQMVEKAVERLDQQLQR